MPFGPNSASAAAAAAGGAASAAAEPTPVQLDTPEARALALLATAPKSYLLPEYRATCASLNARYQDGDHLAFRPSLSEADNARFDANRIQFIIDACSFILGYIVPGKTLLLGTAPQIEGLHEAEAMIQLTSGRALLHNICMTAWGLSGALRGKYKHLLAPAPFTWETFEQLGGILRIAVPLKPMVCVQWGDASHALWREYKNTELLVEAALPELFSVDVLAIRNLFNLVQLLERGPVPAGFAPRPSEFPGIRALTRRMVDVETLIHLLQLTDNRATELPHRDVARLADALPETASLGVPVESGDTRYERTIRFDTTLQQHAALRRLELLGELVTGKNFSTSIARLDPSIDWQVFVRLRDVIAHQDEGDNRHKVAVLLADEDRFRVLMGDEMQALHHRICTVLIPERHRQLPPYQKDADGFWQSIVRCEAQQLTQAAAQVSTPSIIEARATPEDICTVMEALASVAAPEDVQEKIRGILEGKVSIPDKREMGRLMQAFPPRTTHKDLNKACKDILVGATRPQRSTLAQREADRRAEAEAARARSEAREAQLRGLERFRALAAEWAAPHQSCDGGAAAADAAAAPQHLRPVDRIQLAVQALENIRDFIVADPLLHISFDFDSPEAWAEAHDSQKQHEYGARFVSSPEFNDAIEYNAAQLLQHLDWVSKLPEAKGNQYLDPEQNYSMMRDLRNWIEHGNYLHDRRDYEPGKTPSPLSPRQDFMSRMMLHLVLTLLPVLQGIHQQYSTSPPVMR